MSEEILKALTQLFAIITKQDDGATVREKAFIEQFFKSRLSPDKVGVYLELYNSYYAEKRTPISIDGTKNEKDNRRAKLASIRDSLKTLSICKKINKTLTQKQKVVVLVELLELIHQDKNLTLKRKQILDVIAVVFNISKEEHTLIESFVLAEALPSLDDTSLLIVAQENPSLKKTHYLHSESLSGIIIFLKVSSVNLYFVKYRGEDLLQINNIEIDSNHIYLFSNGNTLTPKNGQSIYFSDLVAHFSNSIKKEPLSFNCTNVYFKFPNGAIGLHDINIHENRGALIGIMGASGAGKTTLLNVLAGIETPSSGHVLINGINLHKNQEQVQGLIGYIAQDDLLIEELSVFDNLYYGAKLCFKDKSNTELEALVVATLDSLGLLHIKDIKVGNALNKKISGGQRKRLNIALELIREPLVLFVDEPTSGLSSRDSENVIDLLKELSHRGKLIFVVIHQPSSEIYKKFDKMYFMDTGGYPIYYGNPIEAVIYFKEQSNQINSERGQCITCGNVNPEQVFDIVESQIVNEYGVLTAERKVKPIQWNELYKTNFRVTPVENISIKNSTNSAIPNKLTQWYTYTIRDLKSKLSNHQYLLINLLEAPVLAFVLAFIIRYNDSPSGEYTFRHNENIPAYLLISIVISLFMGLSVSAEEIIKDRKIQKREQFLHLSKTSYLLSKISILFTLSAIQTLTYTLIGNSILEIEGMTLSYWLVLFTCSCMANVLGLNISACFNSAITVYIMIPLLLIPQLFLSGAIFNFEKLNSFVAKKDKTPLISDIMASRWAYEALAVHQFKNNKYDFIHYELDKELSQLNYYQAYLIPELENLVNTSQKEPFTIAILQNEFKKLQKGFPKIDFIEHKYISSLTPVTFDPNTVKKSLRQINNDLGHQYNICANKKEALNTILEKEYSKFNQTTEQIKIIYANETLSEIVRNISTKKRLELSDKKFIQHIDPIYKSPSPTHFFDYRAHQYAPQKHFCGKLIDTFRFNIIVIWLITIFLYLGLSLNLFNKAISSLKKLKTSFNG